VSALVVVLLASGLASSGNKADAQMNFLEITTPLRQECKNNPITFRVRTDGTPPKGQRPPHLLKLDLHINFDVGGSQDFEYVKKVDMGEGEVVFTYKTTGDHRWEAWVVDPYDNTRFPASPAVSSGTVRTRGLHECFPVPPIIAALGAMAGLYTAYKVYIKDKTRIEDDLRVDWGDGTTDTVHLPAGTSGALTFSHTYAPAPDDTGVHGVLMYTVNDSSFGSALVPAPTCNSATTCADYIQPISSVPRTPRIGESVGSLGAGVGDVGVLDVGLWSAGAASRSAGSSAASLPDQYFDVPSAGVNVTYRAPVSGPSCSFLDPVTGAPVSEVTVQAGFDGIASPDCKANNLPGSYTVTATTAGVAQSAAFQITNLPAPVCGTVLRANTVLSADVGPCPGDGLIIGADGITLDLNGFDIYGDGAESVTVDDELLLGDAGVRNECHSNVTITNDKAGAVTATTWGATEANLSRIHGFDAGVYIANKVDPVDGLLCDGPGGVAELRNPNHGLLGSSNTVQKLNIHDNIGSLASDYGEGVVIDDSKYNKVVDNLIVHNGPFAGVALYEDVLEANDGNIVGQSTGVSPAEGGNWIKDNDINTGPAGAPGLSSHARFPGISSQDDGVRIEAGVGNCTGVGTKVENNVVERNGLDGIAFFFGDVSNPTCKASVLNNVVKDNGFHEYVGPLADGLCPEPGMSCARDEHPDVRNGVQAANSGAPGPLGYAQFAHSKGDGIRIHRPNSGHTVSGNTVCGNASNGIRVDGTANTVTGNLSGTGAGCAANNVEMITTPGQLAYDMHDSNLGNPAAPVSCSSNEWSANTFGTANATCIT